MPTEKRNAHNSAVVWSRDLDGFCFGFLSICVLGSQRLEYEGKLEEGGMGWWGVEIYTYGAPCVGDELILRITAEKCSRFLQFTLNPVHSTLDM